MKAAIFGSGRMGKPIAWAMEKLGCDLILIDSSMESLQECNDVLKQDAELRIIDNPDNIGLPNSLCRPHPDVVISSLPYHKNLILAKFCIKNGIRYCDLGGNVEISNEINSLAEKIATKPIMTDMGLAPGLANILTEAFYEQISEREEKKPETVSIMVGGIPRLYNNKDPFNYYCTWSLEGLLNEYTEDCTVLESGEKTTYKALNGYMKVRTKSLGELEAFYTSGGSSHTVQRMKNLGAVDVTYRTLRWPGHLKTINLLINDIELDRDVLKQIFSNKCNFDGGEDCVIIYISIDDKVQELLIPPQNGFSAMQRATGLPTACGAYLLAEGAFDERKCVKYEDIGFEKFNAKMDKLVDEHKDS